MKGTQMTSRPRQSTAQRADSRALLGHRHWPEAASDGGKWRNDNSGDLNVAAGQEEFSLVFRWRPQQDSNLRTRLRRPSLYPLSYGGWRRRQLRHPAQHPPAVTDDWESVPVPGI